MNAKLRELYPESEELFDVVLMTNNHANVGLRLINTINHHREFQGHLGDMSFYLFSSAVVFLIRPLKAQHVEFICCYGIF